MLLRMIKTPSKKVIVTVVPNDETNPAGIPAHGFALFCLRLGDGDETQVERVMGDLRGPDGTPLSSRDVFRIWAMLSAALSEDTMLAAPQRKACKAGLAALREGTKN